MSAMPPAVAHLQTLGASAVVNKRKCVRLTARVALVAQCGSRYALGDRMAIQATLDTLYAAATELVALFQPATWIPHALTHGTALLPFRVLWNALLALPCTPTAQLAAQWASEDQIDEAGDAQALLDALSRELRSVQASGRAGKALNPRWRYTGSQNTAVQAPVVASTGRGRGAAGGEAAVVGTAWLQRRLALLQESQSGAGGLPPFMVDAQDLEYGSEVVDVVWRGSSGLTALYWCVWLGQECVVKHYAPVEHAEAVYGPVAELAGVRSPHVTRMFGAYGRGGADGCCVVSEYVTGGSLFRVLHQSHHSSVQLSVGTVAALCVQVVRGLLALTTRADDPHALTGGAWRRWYGHGRLSSENVLFVDASLRTVKLTNYAMPYLTLPPANWLAPEQAAAMRAGLLHVRADASSGQPPFDVSRADVYALGVLMWEMTTHQVPFDGMVPDDVLCAVERAQRPGPLPDWAYDGELCALMDACMQMDPARRPTLAHLLQRLEPLVDGTSVLPPPSTASPQASSSSSSGLAGLPREPNRLSHRHSRPLSWGAGALPAGGLLGGAVPPSPPAAAVATAEDGGSTGGVEPRSLDAHVDEQRARPLVRDSVRLRDGVGVGASASPKPPRRHSSSQRMWATLSRASSRLLNGDGDGGGGGGGGGGMPSELMLTDVGGVESSWDMGEERGPHVRDSVVRHSLYNDEAARLPASPLPALGPPGAGGGPAQVGPGRYAQDYEPPMVNNRLSYRRYRPAGAGDGVPVETSWMVAHEQPHQPRQQAPSHVSFVISQLCSEDRVTRDACYSQLPPAERYGVALHVMNKVKEAQMHEDALCSLFNALYVLTWEDEAARTAVIRDVQYVLQPLQDYGTKHALLAIKALSVLDTTLVDDDARLIAGIGGAVQIVLRLLRHGDASTHSHALAVLYSLSRNSDLAALFSQHDGIAALGPFLTMPDAALTMSCLRTLSNVARLYKDNKRSVVASLMPPLMAALRHHLHHAGIQAAGAELIGMLPYDNISESTIGTICIMHMVMALQEHPDDVHVQEVTYAALMNLAGDRDNIERIARDEGVQEVMATLERHKAHPRVLTEALGLITNLAVLPQNRSMLVTAGAPAAIVACLQRHPGDPAVVKWGASALMNCASDNDHNRSVVGRGGHAIEVLVGAVNNHQGDHAVQECAIGALMNLIADTDNASSFTYHKGIEAVLGSMRMHLSDAGVQEQGLAVLWNLGHSAMTKVLVVQRRGLEAIDAAMNAHRAHPTVQERGCIAIANLVSKSKENNKAATAQSMVELVVAAMQRHPTSPTVQENALWALYKLCKRQKNKKKLKSLGGSQLITQSRGRHPAHAGVQRCARLALKRIRLF